jgi:hypothetical protein
MKTTINFLVIALVAMLTAQCMNKEGESSVKEDLASPWEPSTDSLDVILEILGDYQSFLKINYCGQEEVPIDNPQQVSDFFELDNLFSKVKIGIAKAKVAHPSISAPVEEVKIYIDLVHSATGDARKLEAKVNFKRDSIQANLALAPEDDLFVLIQDARIEKLIQGIVENFEEVRRDVYLIQYSPCPENKVHSKFAGQLTAWIPEAGEISIFDRYDGNAENWYNVSNISSGHVSAANNGITLRSGKEVRRLNEESQKKFDKFFNLVERILEDL